MSRAPITQDQLQALADEAVELHPIDPQVMARVDETGDRSPLVVVARRRVLWMVNSAREMP